MWATSFSVPCVDFFIDKLFLVTFPSFVRVIGKLILEGLLMSTQRLVVNFKIIKVLYVKVILDFCFFIWILKWSKWWLIIGWMCCSDFIDIPIHKTIFILNEERRTFCMMQCRDVELPISRTVIVNYFLNSCNAKMYQCEPWNQLHDGF